MLAESQDMRVRLTDLAASTFPCQVLHCRNSRSIRPLLSSSWGIQRFEKTRDVVQKQGFGRHRQCSAEGLGLGTDDSKGGSAVAPTTEWKRSVYTKHNPPIIRTL